MTSKSQSASDSPKDSSGSAASAGVAGAAAPSSGEGLSGWGRLTAEGRVPPRRVLITVVVCTVLMALVRAAAEHVDRAVANIATLTLGFIAFMSVLVWFARGSGYPAMTRRMVPLALLGTVIVALAVFRIEEVSGNLIPVVKFRWTPSADKLLSGPVIDGSLPEVDLASHTEGDFPEFLGPGRTASVERPLLDRDWTASPPKVLWRRPIGAGWSAFSAVNGFAVTLEQRGDDELVTCYDIVTGDLRWSHAEKTRHESIMGGIGPRSTPTIHQGRVYALGATGRLVCLDGATGKLVWKFDLLSELKLTPEKDMAGVAWGRANSPLIVDDKVVVPMGGPLVGPSSDSPPKFVSLVALDRKTGEKVWSGGDSQVSYSSPVEFTLAGRRQIVIVNEATVAGHDPTTGRELWSHPWPGGSASSASASQPRLLADDQLLLSKAYGTGAAVIRIAGDGGDKFNVEKVWENSRVLKTKLANVTTYQGHAYGLSDGILECVELATGKSRWKRGRYEHGQLLRVGDCLLVLSESGELLLIDASPEAHRELGKIPLIEGKTWNNLCMFGSILLARNGQEMVAVELKVRTP